MSLPTPLPDEMLLRPGKLKWLGVLAIGLVFVVLGGVMISAGDDLLLAWACTVFFAVVAGTALYMLTTRSNYLKLSNTKFEQSLMGRRMMCRWDEVSNFGVWSVASNKMVAFNRFEDKGKAIASINQAISGGSASLGDTFGMKAKDLVQLMNAFRDRALAAKGQHDDDI